MCAAIAGMTWGSWSSPADACSPDPCAVSERYAAFDAKHERVATDGVLVFETYRGYGGQLTDEEALAFVTLDVRGGDGMPVAGALSLAEGFVVWTPEAALPAGASLTATLSIDQDGIGAPGDGCDLSSPTELAFVVGDEPLPALEMPDVEFETSYDFQPSNDIDALVCCDGAYPADTEDSCGGFWTDWSEGHCVAQRGVGYADGSFVFNGTLSEEVGANVVFALAADGEVLARTLGTDAISMGRALDHAYDATLIMINLATGETLTTEAFAADANGAGDLLGEIEPDISAELAAECSSDGYVCEIVEQGDLGGQAWNPEACEPWENMNETGETIGETETDGPDSDTEGPGESDDETDSLSDGPTDGDDTVDADPGADADGCACRAEETPPIALGWLALLGYGLLARRRRRHTR